MTRANSTAAERSAAISKECLESQVKWNESPQWKWRCECRKDRDVLPVFTWKQSSRREPGTLWQALEAMIREISNWQQI